jgi:arylsulfatase A-like enzyme
MPPHVDGFSLVPLLENPETDIPPALMTYEKGNHAIRTERWRYIQYADGSAELYDHENDDNEWTNVVDKPENKDVVERLRAFVPVDNADAVPDLGG